MLFDTKADPEEYHDLGDVPEHAPDCQRMERLFFDWTRRTSQRTTISDSAIANWNADTGEAALGVLIGFRNQAELDKALAEDASDPAFDD